MRWLVVLGILAVLVVGFLFFRGPAPVIIVAPERIFSIGGLAVTNTMFTSWVVVLLLVTVAFFVGRHVSVVPSGFSGGVEAAVAAFFGIVEGVAGEQNARRFFPLVATIFFFVLTSNYFGLLPMNNVVGKPEAGHGQKQVVFSQTTVGGVDLALIPMSPTACKGAECPPAPGTEHTAAEHAGMTQGAGAASQPQPIALQEHEFTGILAPFFRSVNTDVNTPLAIAIFSFLFVEFWGFQSLGLGYLKKFFNFSRLLRGNPMGLIDVFVGLLELVSEMSRMVSFTFRLFGNIFAGEVLLLMMGFLVPFLLVDVFYGLELFVGLIQAFVFAMLTLVFAVTAVSHHDGEESHHGEAAVAHH